MEQTNLMINQIMHKVKSDRKSRFNNSNQISLGELTGKLELIEDKEVDVYYDFGDMFPEDIDSYRGSYDELALDYTDGKSGKPPTVKELIEILKEADGKTFTGYKGGDYEMNKDTPVWVSNYGRSGTTAIVDVVRGDYYVILITQYMEF